MLNQNQGGLQLQLQETLAELQALGVDAKLADFNTDQLADFDLIHVFSINHGNYHIIQEAKRKGLKVVSSPLLPTNWTKRQGQFASFFDGVIFKLSGWHSRSEYYFDKLSLELSDHIVALGSDETRSASETMPFRLLKFRPAP